MTQEPIKKNIEGKLSDLKTNLYLGIGSVAISGIQFAATIENISDGKSLDSVLTTIFTIAFGNYAINKGKKIYSMYKDSLNNNTP